MNLIKEFQLGSPVLWCDWARSPESGEVILGVATRDGKFTTYRTLDWTQQDSVELEPPTPIWRVAGNHATNPSAFEFALATLNAGVVGVKHGKGVVWQHPFGSSCGSVAYFERGGDKRQLIVAGGLDKTLRGIDPATGKLAWGQVFLEGVGFVDVFEEALGFTAVAGDAGGNIRGFDAWSGKMTWHIEFNQNTRFCLPMGPAEGDSQTWLAGTDDNELIAFDVTPKGASAPLTRVKCNNYPWFARRIFRDQALVSIYNFASLGEENVPAPGELVAVSRDGQQLWSVPLAGSVEAMDVWPQPPSGSPQVYAGTTDGSIARVDVAKGKILGSISVSKTPVNCLQVLPANSPSPHVIAAACDDGRVVIVEIK